MSESSQLTFTAKSSTSCVAACAAAEPMIASIHLPMVRYVVPGGGAHAEEEAAAAASVAGGLLILAKNEGDCINSKLRHQRGKAPASESERSVRLSNLQTDGGQAQMKSWPQISFRRRLLLSLCWRRATGRQRNNCSLLPRAHITSILVLLSQLEGLPPGILTACCFVSNT